MANKLVKNVIPITPAPSEGSGAGGGGGGSGGGLPPKDTACYQDLYAKVAQLWPQHSIVHVQPDKGGAYFRVSDHLEQYVWRVVGVCRNGYLEIRYALLQQPGSVRSA